MKFRRLLWLFLLPGLALLAYLSMEVVRAYLLTPLFYIFRLGELLYKGFPQAICWGVFVFFLAVLALRTLLGERRPAQEATALVHAQRLSRVKSWMSLIERSRRGHYSRWLLAHQVAKLALNLIAYQERVTVEQAHQALHSGALDLPQEIQAYLQIGLDVPSFRHYSDLLSGFRSSKRASPLNLDPEVVLQYLESRSESGGSM